MLEHLFGSTTRLKLLQTFFRHPDRAFYVRELARETNTQLNAVRRELANLTALNIVEPAAPKTVSALERVGKEKSKFFQLNIACLIYDELKALISKVGLMEEQELVEDIKKRGGDIKLFILSGFFTDDAKAVTDIFLVGAVKPVAVTRVIKKFETILNRPLRYTIMEEKEFKERRELGDKFLYGVFESNHVVAIDRLALRASA